MMMVGVLAMTVMAMICALIVMMTVLAMTACVDLRSDDGDNVGDDRVR